MAAGACLQHGAQETDALLLLLLLGNAGWCCAPASSVLLPTAAIMC